MKNINVLIVDDEPLAREIIQTHLSKIPNWTVVDTCINAEEAFETLLKSEIDVVFLDIQMPVITGIEFLESLQNPPLVIFTTAYSEYALKGFELNAVDYLLKPFTFARFYQTVEKVNKKLELQNDVSKTPQKEVTYLFVKHDGKLLKLDFSDILYIKAEQEYSSVFKTNGTLLVSMHLKLLETLLPEKQFTRIHRSYIVPHEIITSVYGNTVQIGTDIQLPIGSKYKEELLHKLQIK
ncbi:LytR/AlgR family response regulator transcription factor [Flagellimonas zhangzhouensis]|uniref:Two component transcriptional regulator, LytTR family n=1 Tax=Flagellimonas zhangzhouensis TaxID=1073328 RepID=A0A1H2SID8_9FLAO|nr:response regulator [Allomuricauda zhangzhouensis]SDQ75209.1 two component transcriptional regulator, LytTR family [Allomuricauda zhangzhouensis]SDW31391.1 two component transcriptional regulator, LytTR family [Allomuricauda zhangzhouensis]